MNFDLADLRAFVAVADLSGFRPAAEALHLSQPALSRRVDKLEQALGFRLFERTTRKVELNAMGRAFLPRARHVLSELEGALLGMTDLAERIHGLVTVACIPSAVGNFVASAVREFHARFPRIRLRVLDQAAPDDGLGKRFDRDAGLDAPDIGLAQHQFVEGDVARRRQDDLLNGSRHVRYSATGGREPLSRPPTRHEAKRRPLTLGGQRQAGGKA